MTGPSKMESNDNRAPDSPDHDPHIHSFLDLIGVGIFSSFFRFEVNISTWSIIFFSVHNFNSVVIDT